MRKNVFAHHTFDFGFEQKKFARMHGVGKITKIADHQNFDQRIEENTPLLVPLTVGHIRREELEKLKRRNRDFLEEQRNQNDVVN